MSKKTIRFVIILLLVGLFVFLLINYFIPKMKSAASHSPGETIEPGSQDTPTATEVAPVMVEATASHRGELIIRVSASGQTEAIRQISIIPKISGEVVALPIHEGKFVQKGDVLMKLEDREYQLSLNEARQKLLKARSEYEIQRLDRKTLNSLVDSSAINRSKQLEQQWHKAQQQYKRGEIDEAKYQKIWLDYQSAQILRGVRHEEMVASRTGFSPAFSDEEQIISL
jgi:multidrug efflux pump subunit AcrA (membrane-fusion protein)